METCLSTTTSGSTSKPRLRCEPGVLRSQEFEPLASRYHVGTSAVQMDTGGNRSGRALDLQNTSSRMKSPFAMATFPLLRRQLQRRICTESAKPKGTPVALTGVPEGRAFIARTSLVIAPIQHHLLRLRPIVRAVPRISHSSTPGRGCAWSAAVVLYIYMITLAWRESTFHLFVK